MLAASRCTCVASASISAIDDLPECSLGRLQIGDALGSSGATVAAVLDAEPCPALLPPAELEPWQGTPKVALLFLTRGDLPYEQLWRAFLDGASDVVAGAAAAEGAAAGGAAAAAVDDGQLADQQLGRKGAFGSSSGGSSSNGGGSSSSGSGGSSSGSAVGSGSGSADGSGSAGGTAPPAGWQRLFRLYTHPAPGWRHPPGSLFAGHEVACRRRVEWGNHTVVEAERALLRAALADPANQRFVLLSESCLPLHPAAVVYAQLMAEQRSRVNACRSVCMLLRGCCCWAGAPCCLRAHAPALLPVCRAQPRSCSGALDACPATGITN